MATQRPYSCRCPVRLINPPEVNMATMKNDLFLVHPPAYFDFRNRKDIYWPFFGTSSGTPITPLYEMFPVGFKSLKRVLQERGNKVDIVNLSTVMLMFPDVDL